MPTPLIKIEGLKELNKLMKFLPDAMQRKIYLGAIREAGKPILKEAKHRARSAGDTGLLAKSIGAKTRLYKRSGVRVLIMGPRTGHGKTIEQALPKNLTGSKSKSVTVFRDPVKYAHLVEGFRQPAKRHDIPNFLGQKGVTLDHPGIRRTRPFMRPAYDHNRHAAVRNFGRVVGKRIVKVAPQLARQVGALGFK